MLNSWQPQQQQGVQNPPQQQAAGAAVLSRLVKLDNQVEKCEWTKSGYRQCRCHHGSNGLREAELSEFKDWIEKFCGWLCLIQDAYGLELAEAINANYQIQPTRSPEQTMRSKRLFHLLQQNFVGYSKIENLIRSQISSTGITESNGFELLRLIRMEFSLMSRTEA